MTVITAKLNMRCFVKTCLLFMLLKLALVADVMVLILFAEVTI